MRMKNGNWQWIAVALGLAAPVWVLAQEEKPSWPVNYFRSEEFKRDFLGSYLTEPKAHVFFDPPEKPLGEKRFATALARRGIRLEWLHVVAVAAFLDADDGIHVVELGGADLVLEVEPIV